MNTVTTDDVLVGGTLFIMEMSLGENPEDNYMTLTEACTCEDDEQEDCEHTETYDFRGIA
jgi:hypothetical protein